MLALRGPAGFLDVWETTHAGRDAPVYLCLDMYNHDDPRAPVGFTCTGGGS